MVYLEVVCLILLGGTILKHKIPILITLVMTVAILLSAASVTVLAAHEDHSNPNSTAERVTLDSADILELVLGIELTESERNYLVAYGGESIAYSDMIPASYVASAYYSESSTLAVYARVYEYSTASGLKKTWTPKTATVGDISVPLTLGTDNKYVSRITNVTEDQAATLDVDYTMSVTISARVLNSIVNKAFDDAPRWDAYEKYLKAKEDYYEAFAAYEAYLIDKSLYDAKLAEYETYLDELAEYEADLLKYAEYEQALEKYNSDYASYLDYLDRLDKYDAELEIYNVYLADMETVNYHLSILDGTIAKATPLGRSVRNAIMGNTVTQVLENRDIIANKLSGIDPAVVDMAGTCTENLRVFYTEYEPIKDEREKYTYYVMNYEKIRDNFVGLFQCLDLLYSNGYVREGIKREGMTEKYEILLAQLYYTVLTVSDAPVSNYDGTAVYDSSYKIDLKTPLSVHYGVPYMVDNGDAKPLEDGYPAEVKKPQDVDAVTEPTKPTAVLRPVEPDAVDDPGEEPAEVQRPISPGAAPAVPGTLENADVLPETVTSLIALYRSGGLSERAEITESKRITLEAQASKKIFNTDEIAINFYGADGTLLDTVNVERGSYVEFSGTVPAKAEDDVATYTFSGWQDADGNLVDMRAVDCGGATLDLYPFFDLTYKLYDVTWILDGKKTVTKERLGVLPTPPFVPSKNDTGSFLYEFKGWNREITPVSSAASENVYTATFESKFIVPFSNGSGAVITNDGSDLLLDCTRSPEHTFDLSNAIPRVAGKYGIVITTKGYTVRISYADVLAMSTLDVWGISVYSATKGVHGYSFRLDLLNGSGQEMDGAVKASVVMPYKLSDPRNARLYYFAEDGGRKYVKATIDGSSLSATVNCGTPYYATLFYAVDVISVDAVDVAVSDTSLPVGSTGTISAEAPLGVEIISYYLIKGNGERIELDGPEFVMPDDSVSVGVVYEYLQYTVKFLSDGVVISVATYKYGELPVPPTAPKKSADASYSYEFAGWDAEICPTTSDAVYNAVYTATPVPVPQKPEGPQISDRVMDLLVRVIVLCAYFCGTVLPIFVVTTVKSVRRLRWLRPRKRMK